MLIRITPLKCGMVQSTPKLIYQVLGFCHIVKRYFLLFFSLGSFFLYDTRHEGFGVCLLWLDARVLFGASWTAFIGLDDGVTGIWERVAYRS